jgi:photosystem II reaction center protein Psb28
MYDGWRGTLETRDNARFVNGDLRIESNLYIMKSPEAWDRFMRFMEDMEKQTV